VTASTVAEDQTRPIRNPTSATEQPQSKPPNPKTPPVAAFATPVNRRLKVLRRTGTNFSPVASNNNNTSVNASPIPVEDQSDGSKQHKLQISTPNWLKPEEERVGSN